MTESRLRIGLVGCGQIADAHLQQIGRVSSAEVVAVCDLEPLLARQAAERFGVPQRHSSLNALLRDSAPDVVHITTPVHTHAPLAIQLLEAGVHVYLEKPFATNAAEAEEVIAVARQSGRLVCLGHDQLFDPAWLRAREIAASGALGEIQHVDSILGYPIDGPFGRLVVSTPDHWVRQLPGGLFQNTISHPLYRITEFLEDEEPGVQANWFSKRPDIPFPTELRANLRGERVSGSLLFTSTVFPHQRVARIYGSKAGLEVDLDTQLVRLHRGDRYPGAFAKLEAPFRQFRESCGNLKRNTGRFLRGEFHYFAGMKRLFEEFYAAVQNGSAPPVSNSEALRVTRIMDRIFDECRTGTSEPLLDDGPRIHGQRSVAAEPLRNATSTESAPELVSHGQA